MDNQKIQETYQTGGELFFILGPCVIESRDHILFMAEKLKKLSQKKDFQLIFKSSFDKANRTSVESYRGPGLTEGLEILSEVKEEFELPLLTDIHQPDQAKIAADVVDILQIPAFLCRQTDLVIAAGETGAGINVKKGQFLPPYDMKHVAQKIESTGNENILLTERGHKFGYENLVNDMRAIPIMQKTGYPVVYDATHSSQKPGGGSTTGGIREYVPHMSRAAVAAGCEGLFLEVHDNPEDALSDSATQYPLEKLEGLLEQLIILNQTAKELE